MAAGRTVVEGIAEDNAVSAAARCGHGGRGAGAAVRETKMNFS